jgi:hypothetical protein
MKYKIYKLIHNGVVVYVGRTKQTLNRRKNGSYKGCGVESIHKECDIELIEETNDASREDFWVQHYKDTLLNIRRGITGLTHKEVIKEWCESNKEHYKEYQREWEKSNREHRNQYQREYRQKTKN